MHWISKKLLKYLKYNKSWHKQKSRNYFLKKPFIMYMHMFFLISHYCSLTTIKTFFTFWIERQKGDKRFGLNCDNFFQLTTHFLDQITESEKKNVNCMKALSDKVENKIYFRQKYQFSSVKWFKKWIILCAIKKHSACVKLSVAPKKC